LIWNIVMTAIGIATTADESGIWSILEPAFRAGETYTIARDIGEVDAIAYWCGRNHETFAAEDNWRRRSRFKLRVRDIASGPGGRASPA